MRCAEPTCRRPFKPYRATRDHFCSVACGKKRHNTKAKRGAKIHDMLLAWIGRDRQQLTYIAQEVRIWRDEDRRNAQRAEELLARSIGSPIA